MSAAPVQDDLWYTDLSPADLWREVLRPVHDTPAALRAVHSDWRPSRVSARESLRLAINECGRDHDGRVHISLFRDLLPPTVPPPAIGAAINAWTKAGYLQLTDVLAPMGGTAGNANKWSAVRRLVCPIPAGGAS